MQRYITYAAIAMLVTALVFFAIIFLQSSQALAFTQDRAITLTAPTATPDAQSVLNQANDAASKADQEASTANTILNIINVSGVVIGVIFGGLTIGFTLLGLFGLSTIRTFRASLEKSQDDFNKEIKQLEGTNKGLVALSLGESHLRNGNYERAIAAYKESLDYLPDFPQASYGLGLANSRIGRYDEAITVLEEASKKKVDYPEIYTELGLTYRRRAFKQDDETKREQDLALAEQNLEKAIDQGTQYRHDDQNAPAILGGLLRRREEYEKALDYYRKAHKVEPAFSSYVIGNIASLTWYLDRPEEAQKYFEETRGAALKCIEVRVPDVYWNHYDLAMARLFLGQKDAAFKDYQTAMRLTPTEVPFESVLDNLRVLQKANRLRLPNKQIDGLDEVIQMLEDEQKKRQAQSQSGR